MSAPPHIATVLPIQRHTPESIVSSVTEYTPKCDLQPGCLYLGEKVQQRLAKLVGGVAVIKVGTSLRLRRLTHAELAFASCLVRWVVGVMIPPCARKVPDTADIVREAIFQQWRRSLPPLGGVGLNASVVAMAG